MVEKQKNYYAIISVIIVILLSTFLPAYDRLNALSVDVLFYLRHVIYGPQHPAQTSHAVVIALDEETYKTEPFAGLPKVLWTPHLAKVQNAVLDSGAKVVGYDIIFPTSIEQFIEGYEKPFLMSLLKWSRQGKLVLGKAQHAKEPISPHPSQRFIVQNHKNIRSLNVQIDVDDTIRRIPLYFDKLDGSKEPSLSFELAKRSAGENISFSSTENIAINGYEVPARPDHTALLNFQGGADIPTYSLADLYGCVENGNSDYFQKHFKDKVVLIGGVLDIEDRKLTSKRFITENGSAAFMDPCTDFKKEEVTVRRDTIPGIYIHATAINNLLRQDFLSEPLFETSRYVIVFISLLTSLLALYLRPIAVAVSVVLLMTLIFSAGVYLFNQNLIVYVLPLVSSVILSYLLMLIFRHMMVDKQKNHIRKMFSLYLEPTLIDNMISSGKLPKLGGETRKVTVWFSDVASFTQLSEGLEPAELVKLMNDYFTVVSDLIEAHGGYIDKYIGDAIVAIFGAPVSDEHHARNAVRASLLVQEKLNQLNREGFFGHRQIKTRIGINSGEAVVGNVGSSKRFNYTVMGDTVNLASRLEGANKAVNTEILISEAVAEQLPDSIVLRRIAKITVKGKTEPTKVYEPLTLEDWNMPEGLDEDTLQGGVIHRPDEFNSVKAFAAQFTQAQQYFMNAEFEKTIDLLGECSDDPACDVLINKAKKMQTIQLPDDWDGTEVLTEK